MPSVRTLQLGIAARKYNYGDGAHKNVIVELSRDLTTLLYRNYEKPTSWSPTKGPSKVKLDDVQGILYGGTSATFKRRNSALVEYLRKKQKYEMYLDAHFSGKKEQFDNLASFGNGDQVD